MKQHRYLPMTEQDQTEMLRVVGVSSIDDLFSDIPEAIRYQGELPLSSRLDESLNPPLGRAGRTQRQYRHTCQLPWRRNL